MLASIIRTMVPVIVGAVVAQAARIGLELPSAALTEVITVAVAFGYYSLARWLEHRWPFLSVLLGSSKQPTYQRVTR